ncbi:MAG TPA: hypothetical protein GX513_09940 [Firmicutes bacterium]|nr:hypothetical protein [Bacillota bacterium]
MTKALVCLTPAESKRLIAKGVAALPEVKGALTEGRLVIAVGTTDTYVAEEILGEPFPKGPFAAGFVGPQGLMETAPDVRMVPVVLVKGKRVDVHPREILEEFGEGDVFIKGANAVDPGRAAGIFLGGASGGTIGLAIGYLAARGSHLIVPVGLEKLVPSVELAAGELGSRTVEFAMGEPVGLMPVFGAQVITEIEALEVLAGVEVTHVGSGGVGGAEGSVVLLLEGERPKVERAFQLCQSLKGEPPFPLPPARQA